MSGFSAPLNPQNPTTFTYLGQQVSGGPIIGGVLIGDYVNNSATTPAGSAYNVPSVTLVNGVPISAQLELQSTTGALCVMRMTTTQRNALITVVNGMMIYNTSTTTFQFYQNGAWVSLSAGAGGVTGPGSSTNNGIATFNGTSGAALNSTTATVDGSGNLTATSVAGGASGSAGTVKSFPATAANGSLILAAVNAGGAFNTTISNGTMGQSTVYTLGDIGTTTGGIVVATSAIRMKAVAAATAAGGAAAQSFTDAFCTSGSVVIGNWVTQTTPVEVVKIVPGNGSFVVTSTADAGAGTFSYIITK